MYLTLGFCWLVNNVTFLAIFKNTEFMDILAEGTKCMCSVTKDRKQVYKDKIYYRHSVL